MTQTSNKGTLHSWYAVLVRNSWLLLLQSVVNEILIHGMEVCSDQGWGCLCSVHHHLKWQFLHWYQPI